MKIPFVTKWSHRSSEPAGPSNSAAAQQQQQQQAPSPPPPVASTEAAGDEFILQEEEYQMQLALALSASASGAEGAGDPDGEQIRKAKLMSLGKGHPVTNSDRGGGDTPESLSRRYRASIQILLIPSVELLVTTIIFVLEYIISWRH